MLVYKSWRKHNKSNFGPNQLLEISTWTSEFPAGPTFPLEHLINYLKWILGQIIWSILGTMMDFKYQLCKSIYILTLGIIKQSLPCPQIKIIPLNFFSLKAKITPSWIPSPATNAFRPHFDILRQRNLKSDSFFAKTALRPSIKYQRTFLINLYLD